MWFWNTFGPLIIAIGNLIWSIINFVVVLAFALFKLAVLILAVVVIAAIMVIKVAFMILGAIVMWVWNTLLKPVFDAFMAIIAAVWSFISPYLEQIGAWFSEYLGPIISAFVSAAIGFFTWLWSGIVAIWNGIVGFISGAVNVINGTASGISNFVNSVVGFFTGLVNSISSAINSVTSKISSISGAITGALSSAGTWLYDAGKSIIQGLINGLDSMWQSLKDKASSIAGSIRDFFPFSPAKTGPLSGSGSPEIAGGKIISMVSDGMTAQIPDLKSVTGTVASAVQLGVDQMVIPSLVSGPIPVAAMAGAGTGGNTYYLTVNALDPKSAARSVMDSIGEWERSNGKGWRKP
jgi:phage-related protein